MHIFNNFLINMEGGAVEEIPLSKPKRWILLKNLTGATRNPYVVSPNEFLFTLTEFFSGFTLRGFYLWCNVSFMSHFYLRVFT